MRGFLSYRATGDSCSTIVDSPAAAVLKLWFAFIEESLDSLACCVGSSRCGNLSSTDSELGQEIFADRLVQELFGQHCDWAEPRDRSTASCWARAQTKLSAMTS